MKKLAVKFLKKFNITDLNLENFSEAIGKQGYTIVEYSKVVNSDDVENLLLALGVKALSLTTGAFTYADKTTRIVFIEEGLSDDEKIILLAHEQGHIFCGHMNNMNGIIGDDIKKEQEANEFAHYLLKRGLWRKITIYFSINKLKSFLIFLVFIAVLTGVVLCIFHITQNNHKPKFFRTYHGECYHQPDCLTLNGNKGYYDTAENFKKDNIRPCKVCIPETN